MTYKVASDHSVRKHMVLRRYAEDADGTVRCCYCQRRLDRENMTLDHVVPKSRGGDDSIENLVPSCHPCNGSKSSLDAEDFVDWLNSSEGQSWLSLGPNRHPARYMAEEYVTKMKKGTSR